MLSLFGGGVLPIVLLLMVMDLESRRRQRRRQWRARRRGQPSSAAYGDEGAMSSMDAEPSRFLMQGPGRGAAPTARPQPGPPAPPSPSTDQVG